MGLMGLRSALMVRILIHPSSLVWKGAPIAVNGFSRINHASRLSRQQQRFVLHRHFVDNQFEQPLELVHAEVNGHIQQKLGVKPLLKKHIPAVQAVLHVAGWDRAMFDDPNNEQDLVAVLKKPWLYYRSTNEIFPGLELDYNTLRDKKKMPLKLSGWSLDEIEDVHHAAIVIAAALMKATESVPAQPPVVEGNTTALHRHINQKLQEAELGDFITAVHAVLQAASWRTAMFDDPNNEQDLVADLKKPWLYYDDKKKMPPGLDLDDITLGKVYSSAIMIAYALMKKQLEETVEPRVPEPRVAEIDFLVELQSSKHDFDLNRFILRVAELFEWHTNNEIKRSYMAPYFPLVQSSGSGKTKLLFAAHQFFGSQPSPQYKSFLVLCTPVTLPTRPSIYTHTLTLPVSSLTLQEQREKLYRFLDDIIKPSQRDDITEPSQHELELERELKYVVFFDEAQFLLMDNDAFLFRCVRWWLRMERGDKKIVAVFTGTTSELANDYKEHPLHSGSSRNPNSLYVDSGTELYEPFLDLCTTGIFAPRKRLEASSSSGTDFQRAVPYGRPLFALLQQHNKLTEQAESAILKRMVLSRTSWFDDDLACLSILSTRVQMGQTSLSVASQLVKKGYANLTYFSAKARTAQIAYFPDPVCARLAMCVMDPAWSLEVSIFKFQGHAKKKWSEKIIRIMSSGLCRPHKGDLGEVAAALFLLFCGDELRAKEPTSSSTKTTTSKPDYRRFSISLNDYVSHAILQSDCNPEIAPPSSPSNIELEGQLNFIQVCRDHFRPGSFAEHFDPKYLAWLYAAGCGCYVYSGCPAIDLVVPILRNDGVFVPMVVSVKARRSYCSSETESSFQTMKDILEKESPTGGVCVLFLIGLDNPVPSHVKETSDSSSSILICLTENDAFGLSNVVTQTTIDGDAVSEVFTSHPFLHPRVKTEPEALFRRTPNKEAKQYCTDLHVAFEGITD